MTIVYFLRHSIRDTTVKHEMAPLSKKGKVLAEKLVPYFLNQEIQHIFASPFQRTIDTVKPTANALKQSINLRDGLTERRVGRWVADFDAYAKQQWEDFDYKLAEGESLNDVKSRIVPTFNEILSSTAGDCIICGHGTAFSVLFYELTKGQFGYDQFQTLTMPDVFIGKFDHQHQLIQFENQKLHLLF